MNNCIGITNAVVDEQLTYIVNQLKYVVKLLEVKTAKKDGSQASVEDFNRYFWFSNFPAETWLTTLANTVFRASACALIRAHQSAMKAKRDAGLGNDAMHVKSDSKDLLQRLMDLYFAVGRIELISERPYSCLMIWNPSHTAEKLLQ